MADAKTCEWERARKLAQANLENTVKGRECRECRRPKNGFGKRRLTIKANQRCRSGAVREGREIQTLIEDGASQRQRPS